MPIAQRIGRLFGNENLVKILQQHSTRKEDGFMRDIWDTNRWKEDWYGTDGEFKGVTKAKAPWHFAAMG